MKTRGHAAGVDSRIDNFVQFDLSIIDDDLLTQDEKDIPLGDLSEVWKHSKGLLDDNLVTKTNIINIDL